MRHSCPSLSAPRALVLALAVGSFAALAPACNSAPPDVPPCGSTLDSEVIVVTDPGSNFPPEQGTLRGQCLARTPDIHEDGTAECVVLQATAASACDCSTPGLQPVSEQHAPLVDKAMEEDVLKATCYCEIVPLAGEESKACREDESEPPQLDGEAVQGYCVVSKDSSSDDVQILDACPQVSRAFLRLAGDVQKLEDKAIFMYCASTVCDEE